MCCLGPYSSSRQKWQSAIEVKLVGCLPRLGQSNAIERMEGVRAGVWLRERRVRDVDRGSKLRSGITATKTSHNTPVKRHKRSRCACLQQWRHLSQRFIR